MKKKPNESVKSKYLLFAMTAVCCVIIFLSFTTEMKAGPLKYVAGYILTPIQNGVNEIGTWLADKGTYFQNSTNVAEENKQLQARIDELTAENTQLLQEREELDRLRELYELDNQYEDYEKVGARIIAKDTGNWFNMFTIDKGSNDGIQENMNVIAGGGLVGIVTEVGPEWSTVRAIIDDNSNVSAMVSVTGDTCIIAGDLRLIDEGKIRLVKLLDNADKVTVGDKVVTSDISDRFLPGILIGYISEIEKDSNNLTKSGTITGVVDFRHLHEVLVIKELKQIEDAKEALGGQDEETEGMIVETESDSEEETSSEAEETESETEGE